MSSPLVNPTGITQFRLRFSPDDNAGLGADYLRCYSGNAGTEADRPELIVTYSLPQGRASPSAAFRRASPAVRAKRRG